MEGEDNILTLKINGMTCSHCVQNVRKAIQNLPNVEEVNIDLASGKAFIKGTILDTNQIIKSIEKAGYSVD